MATVKITKKQIRSIIAEEMAHSVPLNIGGAATAPIEVPAEEEKGAVAKFIDENLDDAIAWMLVGLSQGDRKNSVGGAVKKFGDATYATATRAIDTFCDKAGSWSGWGEYQSAATKACKIAGRGLPPALGAGAIKLLLNGVALALSVIDSETINDFAAETYPHTKAGKQALKKKQARIAAEKKAAGRKRRAVKESIRRIVAKETGRRES